MWRDEIYDEVLEGHIIRPNEECGYRFQYKNPTWFLLRQFEQQTERINKSWYNTMENILVGQYCTTDQMQVNNSWK